MSTTQPIRNQNQVRQIAEFYRIKGQLRNYVLVVLGLHTALRISDLLRITWDDVYDFANNRVRTTITITEKKTNKSKIIALHKSVVGALTMLAATKARPGKHIIESPRTGKSICREQAYRIIRAAAEAVGIEERVSCHSLRKTFGYHAWKGGTSPAVIMDIYNHSSLAVTRRYLGVSQDDRNAVYLGLDFMSSAC